MVVELKKDLRVAITSNNNKNKTLIVKIFNLRNPDNSFRI